MIWTLFQVALGGAIGSVARFVTTTVAMRAFGTGFPYGTIVVNVAGSFAMGLVFVWLAERDQLRHAPLVMAGVLGGFTTFSAFSLDAFRLWEQGAAGLAVVYVGGSVVLSLLALGAGVLAMRGVMG
ncbi:MAG: fluoride efflux transporter CrcB [Gemmobacter sp.]|nr:fluoride efflux transporter CrcB [Gemmobacter sp.]